MLAGRAQTPGRRGRSPRTGAGLTPAESSEVAAIAAAIRGGHKTPKPLIDLFPEHCGVQGTKARINPLA